ncbi:hypothetical protein BJY00DRAFT_316716 [Aspergillus carlsbadensis]|nr:hypothetical protein BJY00DRAFT_316716 [Aspergillus carlsbadensis]
MAFKLQEISALDADEFRSIHVSDKKPQLNSCARLPAFIALAVVREAWATTLSRLLNATRPLTFNIEYVGDSITLVEVKFASESPPITPPASPGTTLGSFVPKQTSIVYINPSSGEKISNLQVQSKSSILLSNQSNIGLEVIHHDFRWHVTLWYRSGAVSSAQANELVEHFQHDLEVVVESLAAALPPSPPGEAAEEAEVSVEAIEPSECPKIDRCIHDLVEEQVVTRPQQEAVCAHDGSLSYARLSALSSTLSHHLTRLGACPEQRVAILMPKSRWYSVAVLATLKAGAAFVPLDPSHPDNRLRQLIEDIEPCALITTSLLSSRSRNLGCPNVLAIDDMVFGTPPGIQVQSSVNPSNAAYMIFTSGSTGKPKGVVIEHAALATSAVTRGAVLRLGPESRVLQYAPHTFDVSVDEILTTLIHGGCVCVPSENDRFMIAEFMEAKRVTAALLTPTSARTLNPDDVPSLRTLQTGGEVLTEDVNDKWSNRVTLFNVYGPTEASVACVISNRTGLQGTGHVLGRAVGGKCWVVDPEDIEQRLAPNEIGELLIAGPILARGYFRDSVRTEASFVRLATGERVYKTGDLASMDADGTISYHGRKDLEVKIRGQRINIAEVEHAIMHCDFVHSAVVEYPRLGPCAERLVAIICAKSSDSEVQQPVELFAQAQALDDESLRPLLDHVSGVLTAAMVPSKWITLPYLPQTTSTKVDRKQVRTWLENMETDVYNQIFHSPLDVRSESALAHDTDDLVAVWSQVLKLEPRQLHLNQSFIRNGGDSIMAMEARTLAHSAGIVVKIHDLLSSQSLHEIGVKATSSSQSVGPSTFEEDTDEPFALSPVQQMYFEKIQDPSLGLQQRVSVEVTQPIHADQLRVALNYLVHQHEVLAVRFTLRNGTWVQQIATDRATEEPLYGLYTTPPGPLQDFCTAPMSIEQGPLFHAHLHASYDGPQTLILCAHHLVVDFVSWRVILHDLHDALLAAQTKAALQPVMKPTLTFQQWCREQVKYASSLLPDAVLPYQPGPVDPGFWQRANNQPLTNTYAGVVRHEFRLSSTQTAQLLARFNQLPSLHPTDAMIGAFAMAFGRIFPERETPSIFIENHGREPWHPSLDVSRTVGWFTAAYPIHLSKSTLHELEAAILAAGERRQATPANGHAYWSCRWLSAPGKEAFANDSRHQEMEVVFNYAGSVVQRAPDHGLFGDGVRTAETGHPDCPRFSLFDIVATIEQPEQELVVSYSFPGNIAHQARIHELLHAHQQLLARAVDENRGIAPLSGLLSRPADVSQWLKERGIDMNQDIEMIYPVSPIQQHMLQRQALEPWYYRVRGTWVLEKATKSSSAVDTERLIQAWRKVVHRHSTLRTVYTYSNDLQKFIAVVLRNVSPFVSRLTASNETTTRSLCRDTESPIPPHSMMLCEMSDGAVECQFEFSHVIIDAASRSIVLQHLADAYEGTTQQQSSEAPSYWEYLNKAQSGVGDSPITTQSLTPSGAVAALPFELPQSGTSIFETCVANEITISSFFMTAWAIVLSQQLDNESVSFDYVLSDRSFDISGIDSAVGLFIRLPACEIAIAPDTSVVELARQVHAQRARVAESENCLPSKSTATQGLATLVNIRNSGTESLDMTAGSVRWSLRSFDDPWDYDLVFAVNVRGSQVLGCSIEYTEGVVAASVASGFAKSLTKAVGTMMQEMILVFSPIARFPGPKLAAVTFWYEFYYDVVQRGQYFRQIDKMHQRYGPIVRVNPFELHVQDPEFYPVLYTGPTRRRHKWPWAARMFGNSTSAFSTVAHDHHRIRRAALNPLFSRTAIQRMTPRIQDRLQQLCHRLDDMYSTARVFDLGLAFTVFAADVITEYCFGRTLDLVHSPDFAADWVEMVAAPSELSHLVKQCPWIVPVFRHFPQQMVRLIAPGVALLYEIQDRMSRQIQPLADRKQIGQSSHPLTVFDTLLVGDLPPAEKTVTRLKGEGQTLIGAGTLTTGNALKTIVFHVLDNPNILHNLRAELDTALSTTDPLTMPDPTTQLERLPYLTACINEGLRLAYGVTHRLQLIAEEPLQCCGMEIPAGTPVGMTSIFMHDNPAVFPSPRTFRPERWLEMDSETRGKVMGRNFVPFSKGSRMCLGMHLAYAELYLVLATVFRRYEVEMAGVTREDIDMAHDFFDPAPKRDAKGLIVRLRKRVI